MLRRTLTMSAAHNFGKRLENKVCVVTASTEGIGYAIAKRLGLEGGKIVVSSRKQKNVDEAVKALKNQGIEVVGTTCHVANAEDRKKLFELAVEKYGGINCLVSNAAVNPSVGSVSDTVEEVWDKIFDVNVKSSYLLAKEVKPFLQNSGGGSIVFVSSIGGYQPMNLLGAYSVSKTALLGLTKALAVDLINDKIRVNCVAPGVIETKFAGALHESESAKQATVSTIPMGRLGKPDEIGGVVAFLCSDDASYMTGETVAAAGGMNSRLTPIRRYVTQFFVPKHEAAKQEDIEKLQEFLRDKPRILVLTGAGISTESGIPDYRSEGVGLYQRSNHKPVQYPEYLKSQEIRKRYWARNFIGWPRFSAVEPNFTHKKLAKMEKELRLLHVVTQNVDNLHSKAGSKEVTELHGNGYNVICIGTNGKDRCDYSIDRHDFQQILQSFNADLIERANQVRSQSFRPDGDVDISSADIQKFYLPACPQCGGALKPNIVFFGDNIPMNRIEKVVRLIIDCDGVLVLGSSLQVFSGFRIVLQAKELGLKTAIINIGETRADKIADLKINSKCSEILKHL